MLILDAISSNQLYPALLENSSKVVVTCTHTKIFPWIQCTGWMERMKAPGAYLDKNLYLQVDDNIQHSCLWIPLTTWSTLFTNNNWTSPKSSHNRKKKLCLCGYSTLHEWRCVLIWVLLSYSRWLQAKFKVQLHHCWRQEQLHLIPVFWCPERDPG